MEFVPQRLTIMVMEMQKTIFRRRTLVTVPDSTTISGIPIFRR